MMKLNSCKLLFEQNSLKKKFIVFTTHTLNAGHLACTNVQDLLQGKGTSIKRYFEEVGLSI